MCTALSSSNSGVRTGRVLNQFVDFCCLYNSQPRFAIASALSSAARSPSLICTGTLHCAHIFRPIQRYSFLSPKNCPNTCRPRPAKTSVLLQNDPRVPPPAMFPPSTFDWMRAGGRVFQNGHTGMLSFALDQSAAMTLVRPGAR